MNGLKEGAKIVSFGVELVTFKGFSAEMTPLKKHKQADFENNKKTLLMSCNQIGCVRKKCLESLMISADNRAEI
jgi:hypothetical protein